MPGPTVMAWYCSWCEFGPNSIVYDVVCPNCRHLKGEHANIGTGGSSAPPDGPQTSSSSKSRRSKLKIRKGPKNEGIKDNKKHSSAIPVTTPSTTTTDISLNRELVGAGDRYLPSSTSSSSLQSLADSITSLASVSPTSSLASSVPEAKTAFQRVFSLLRFFSEQYDELLTKASPEKVSRNLGTLFKKFARDLEKVATTGDEKHTAKFVRSHARKLAQGLVESSSQETPRILRDPELDESDESQAENVQEDPDDFLDLEAFIMTSDAFQQLRLDIQLLLGHTYLEKSAANFDDHSSDVSLNNKETVLVALTSSKDGESSVPPRGWNLNSIGKYIWTLLVPEPPIPRGMTRVKWQCACGEALYDDYLELELGAAREMEQYLQTVNYRTPPPSDTTIRRAPTKLLQHIYEIVQFVVNKLRGRRSPVLVETELRYYSESRATRTPPHTLAEVYYLLTCYNDRVGAEAVRLRQLDVSDIDNDQALFQCLHAEYSMLRTRWCRWLSLWSLQSIRFAKFELFGNDLIDIKKLDEVPPPTKDLEYRHGPPNPPKIIPPLGPEFLKHMFQHPELAGSNRHCLNKIPRRLRDRLVVVDRDYPPLGWGLQFVEGWSKRRLMYVAAVIFGLGSFIVMILVSVLGQNIQNAGAIASFMLSLVTIGVAALQAGMHMS
ncbi:uncharacterized protein LY89DRAFT_753673 [Mollisia scopiformis]|uniref:Uncharacterized protein n=1 Tax=Mollisia scopiformis TaxID=149040 RepID=A0A194WZW9_MOLSC|nr:uncharacterized protein LY89DRAFT_753673 [Mollisia scopiformis]KUJ13162.1 hypothetical protein LY89DRAFT_753673 [Mollisia scopiformis]